ncbi:NAD(P)H-dependent flavin oxidoreductase [Janibacter melonis]|uniref:NAD(P)H-dependent flavin oxidoreductase n=1 Tax=Janibacter melonis TaxID=262209 RepID=UPI0025B5ED6A|nr:nitronate monooxygenase [Janibacter melonis]
MAALTTRFTEMFGVEHPSSRAACSGSAGRARRRGRRGRGVGVPHRAHAAHPGGPRRRDRALPGDDRPPFAVNLTILPTITPPPYAEYRDAIAESGVRVAETAGNLPTEHVEALKPHGIKIIHKCTSVRHALKAQAVGVDAVSIDGFECAGHPGEDDVTALVLVPLAAAALDVPLVASGGIADARGLVAALALGADAVNMGTRFMATAEAPVHDAVKQALVERDEHATNLILRQLRNTSRVAKNAVSDEVAERLAEGADFEQVRELVAGARGGPSTRPATSTQGSGAPASLRPWSTTSRPWPSSSRG